MLAGPPEADSIAPIAAGAEQRYDERMSDGAGRETGGQLKVAVSGMGGLVGSALLRGLESNGHTVRRITRTGPERGGPIAWSLPSDDLDAVVHLAGEPIVGRWTKTKKKQIRDSRVEGTRLLCEAIQSRQLKLRVLIAASAVGFYGDRHDEWLDEGSGAGCGFLADTCVAWEQATRPAVDRGVRVVNLRIGLVLSPAGGALQKMLPVFRLGLAGVLGDGRQWWSWIAIEDLVSVIQHCLETDALHGPVNAVCPQPVTNRQFTKILGRVLRRPTVLAVPRLAVRLAFGAFADEAFLASQRVKPARLAEAGYAFKHPNLEEVLAAQLRR